MLVIKRVCSSIPKPVSMTRNTLFNTFGCLAYQGCMWVTTVLVVLLSGYESSGVLAYAMAVGNIFLSIASFNIRVYQVSDTSNSIAAGGYLIFRLITICLSFGLMVPYTVATTVDPALIIPVVAFLLFKMDEAFVDVLYGIDQKAGRMDYIGISQLTRGVGILLTFTISLKLTHSIVVAFTSMFVMGLIVTFGYDLPHALRFGDLRLQLSFDNFKQLLFDGFPIVLSITLYNAITSTVRQEFGNQFGTEALGLYAAVATPAVLVQAAARYFYSPILVPLSDSEARGDRRGFINAYRSTLVRIGFIGIASLLILMLVGPFLLAKVYGETILQYLYLIPGVVLCTFALAFVNFLLDILTIMRDMRFGLVFSILGLIVATLSSRWMIPTYYMNGINCSILMGALTVFVLSAIRVHSLSKRW